jgi:hypothetical protein
MCQNVARPVRGETEDNHLKLLAIYTLLVIVGEAAAVGLGELVELSYPNASLLAFLGLFFLMLWVAWRAALRLSGD